MSIVNCKAILQCDGCGIQFTVEIDTGSASLASIWSHIKNNVSGAESYQGEHFLCHECTKLVDRAFANKEGEPSYEEVHEILKIDE